MSDLSAAPDAPPRSMDETPPSMALEQILREYYGLSGDAQPADEAGNSHVIDNGHMRYRLDIGDADRKAEWALEARILRHLARQADAPDAPEPVATQDGQDAATLTDEGGKTIRLISIHHGIALPQAHKLEAKDVAGIGRLAGAMAKSLADFEDPELERPVDTDLRQAGPTVLKLLSDVTDHAVRDPIAKVLVTALRHVQPLGSTLRIQPVHHDLTLAHMAGRLTEDGVWQAEGITNTSSVINGWLVASLAVTCADLIVHDISDPFDLLPAIRAFHEIHALTESELKALWPLIVARTCVLAAQAEHDAIARAQETGETIAVAASLDHEARKAFAVATGVHPALMEAAILDATEFDLDNRSEFSEDVCRLLPEIDVEQIRLANLGIDSPLLADGNWADPEIDWRLLARVSWETHMGATRYGEYRMSRSMANTSTEPDNYALHVDICVPAGSVVVAPFGGILKGVGQQLILEGRDATLYLEGLVCPLTEGMALFAEDAIGSVAGAEGAVGGLRIRLCRHAEIVPPLFTTPSHAGAWRRLCPSPSQLLGIDVDAPPQKQGQAVRGWRAHVYDGTGRALIDVSGDAGIIGHGHPALAEAAYRQWSLLSGQSSSLAEQRFRQQLQKILPQGLDVIAAIGNERDIMELAQNLLRNDDRQPGFFDLEDGAEQNSSQVLRIADERQTGFGRTGNHMWAFEKEPDLPDIMVTGSILPGKPLAALVIRSDLESVFENRSDIDSVDFAVASAALAILQDEELQENARLVGSQLRTALEPLVSLHDIELSGEGLDIGLIMPESNAEMLTQALQKRGFVTPSSDDPQHIRLRPPLCLDLASAEKIVQALAEILSTIQKQEEKFNKNKDVSAEKDNDGSRLLSAETPLTI